MLGKLRLFISPALAFKGCKAETNRGGVFGSTLIVVGYLLSVKVSFNTISQGYVPNVPGMIGRIINSVELMLIHSGAGVPEGHSILIRVIRSPSKRAGRSLGSKEAPTIAMNYKSGGASKRADFTISTLIAKVLVMPAESNN
jgi:hypothetical protein